MKTVFVSSTFRDFQTERDMLRNQVLPALNSEAGQYGQRVSFCDLRWGIDTTALDEGESSAKILDVCLDEIDRSRPYLLVFLGKRYGFMPGPEPIQKETKRKNFEIDDYDISVTALEIAYGLWRCNGDYSHVYFYVRNLDSPGKNILSAGSGEADLNLPSYFNEVDPAHLEKLKSLLDYIQGVLGSCPDHIRTYDAAWDGKSVTGLTNVAKNIVQDLTEALHEDWEEASGLKPFDRDRLAQWNFLRELERPFRARLSDSDNVISLLKSDNLTSVLAVTGKEGSGKSALFAHVCEKLSADGMSVIPIFGGNTTLSSTAYEVMKNILWQLEVLNESRHAGLSAVDDRINSVNRLRDLMNKELRIAVKKGHTVLVAVDAVNQLLTDKTRNELAFLPDVIPGKARVFITALSSTRLNGSVRSVPLPDLNQKDAELVIQGIREDQGKEIDASVKEAMLKKAGMSNPLYIYLVTTRLLLFNAEDFEEIAKLGNDMADMAAISAYSRQIIAKLPSELEKMGVELIRQIGKIVSDKFVTRTAEYIAASKRGLRTEDLDALFTLEGSQFLPLQFARFIHFIPELFILRADGRYDFTRQSVREGILQANAAEPARDNAELSHIYENLLRYFKEVDPEDPVRAEEFTRMSIQNDAFEDLYAEITREVHRTGSYRSVSLDAAADELYARMLTDQGAWLKKWLHAISVHTEAELATLYHFMNSRVYQEKISLSGFAPEACSAMLNVYHQPDNPNKDRFENQEFAIQYAVRLFATATLMTETSREKRAIPVPEIEDLYQKSAALLEENAAAADREARECLSAVYNRLGFFYSVSGDSSIEKCSATYAKQMKLCENIDKEYNDDRSAWQLAMGYRNMGNACFRRGYRQNPEAVITDADSLRKSVTYAKNAADILENLYNASSKENTLYHVNLLETLNQAIRSAQLLRASCMSRENESWRTFSDTEKELLARAYPPALKIADDCWRYSYLTRMTALATFDLDFQSDYISNDRNDETLLKKIRFCFARLERLFLDYGAPADGECWKDKLSQLENIFDNKTTKFEPAAETAEYDARLEFAQELCNRKIGPAQDNALAAICNHIALLTVKRNQPAYYEWAIKALSGLAARIEQALQVGLVSPEIKNKARATTRACQANISSFIKKGITESGQAYLNDLKIRAAKLYEQGQDGEKLKQVLTEAITLCDTFEKNGIRNHDMADLYNKEGTFRLNSGDADGAVRYWTKSLRLYAALAEEKQDPAWEDLEYPFRNLIRHYKGNAEKQLYYYEWKLELYNKLSPSDDEKSMNRFADLYAALANLYTKKSQRQKQQNCMKKAESLYRKLACLKPDDAGYQQQLANYLDRIFSYYLKSEKKEEGLPYLKEAVEIFDELGKNGFYSQYMINDYHYIGYVYYYDPQEISRGLDYLRKAFELCLRFASKQDSFDKDNILSNKSNRDIYYNVMDELANLLLTDLSKSGHFTRLFWKKSIFKVYDQWLDAYRNLRKNAVPESEERLARTAEIIADKYDQFGEHSRARKLRQEVK